MSPPAYTLAHVRTSAQVLLSLRRYSHDGGLVRTTGTLGVRRVILGRSFVENFYLRCPIIIYNLLFFSVQIYTNPLYSTSFNRMTAKNKRSTSRGVSGDVLRIILKDSLLPHATQG